MEACLRVLRWEREGEGDREVEGAGERGCNQRGLSPERQKGRGQEQGEMLARDRGREALLPRREKAEVMGVDGDGMLELLVEAGCVPFRELHCFSAN